MAKQATLGSGEIRVVSLAERMEQAFLDYSMSVIVGRALPDVRDGCKPVQRRILYSMWESGLHPDRPFRKCASAVGEVMKKYHPHGDSSIYDALVRLAQDFSTRELLVDGHGNFGSIDGDPPAAMRYTECRLSQLSMELLAGIDEDTVDFAPNYDGYEEEPTVLPSRFPNLLVNGATGIAVGMATNMAPHNLGETIDAAIHLVRNADATLDDLMAFIPAPDFPTGARIIATDGIRDSYETGRGAITCEAVATTEIRTGNLPRIVVTEIPYQVNKSSLLEKIADLVGKKKLSAVRDLRDESSRDGMRIVIELKRGEDPAAVLSTLYGSTDLRTNFNANNVALVDKQPQTLGLVAMLRHYLSHQRDIVRRRTEHRLAKAEARSHVVEGLLKALDHLDEVIALIRASASASEAKDGLMSRFELSEIQAQAVLDMRLRRLAALERAELEDEYQRLQDIIAGLRAILGDTAVLDDLLVEELTELRRVHATPRRSRIVRDGISTEDVLAGGTQAGFEAREITVMVTRGGYVKSLPRRRTTPGHKHPRDPLVAVVRATTDEDLLLVTTDGTGYRLSLADVPVVTASQRGTQLGSLLPTAPAAGIAGAVPLVAGMSVVTVSAQGQVKRTEVSEYVGGRTEIQAAGTKPGDELVQVLLCNESDDLVLANSAGYITRFNASEARVMGRTAAGVAGMNVPKGAVIVAASVVASDDTGQIMTIGDDGSAKRTPLSEYGVKGRGGKGVQTGVDALLWAGAAGDVHVHGDSPAVIRPVDVREAGRTAGGQVLDAGMTGPVVAEYAPDDDE